MGFIIMVWKGAAPFASAITGERVNLLVAQTARNDGDRNRKGADRLAGDVGDERPRPLLAGAGGEHKERDVLVLRRSARAISSAVSPSRMTCSGSTPTTSRA